MKLAIKGRLYNWKLGYINLEGVTLELEQEAPEAYDLPPQSLEDAIREAVEELGPPAFDLEPPA